MDEKYTTLIDKVSSDIVSKSKMSQIVAEELRNLDKKLSKKCVTRWNSILFMIRSVLKVSPAEFKTIRNSMPTATLQQKEVKKKFDISPNEREMLEELKVVLEMFEFVTDEFQTNKVSISRVYPSIRYLERNLIFFIF